MCCVCVYICPATNDEVPDLVIADYTDKTMSRSRLLRDFMMMRRRVQKEILLGKQIGVPRPGRSPGREPKPITR